jgi:hypothetical protein
MLKYFKALGVAGLTTISASQLALAGSDNVLWSQNKDNGDVIVSGITVAARAISQSNQHHPMVRFTSHEVGGSAIVPLWPYDQHGRCTPDFDPAPFQAAKGSEAWAKFEFVNIDKNSQDLIAFAIKAHKPGCKDRYRVSHDIGNGRQGNKPAMIGMISPPTEGDYGYYFMDRGILKVDEILRDNPGAAVRITISNHTRGPVV